MVPEIDVIDETLVVLDEQEQQLPAELLPTILAVCALCPNNDY